MRKKQYLETNVGDDVKTATAVKINGAPPEIVERVEEATEAPAEDAPPAAPPIDPPAQTSEPLSVGEIYAKFVEFREGKFDAWYALPIETRALYEFNCLKPLEKKAVEPAPKG